MTLNVVPWYSNCFFLDDNTIFFFDEKLWIWVMTVLEHFLFGIPFSTGGDQCFVLFCFVLFVCFFLSSLSLF